LGCGREREETVATPKRPPGTVHPQWGAETAGLEPLQPTPAMGQTATVEEASRSEANRVPEEGGAGGAT